MNEITARPASGRLSAAASVGTAGRPVLAAIALIVLMLPITFPVGTWLMSPSRLLFMIMLPFMMIALFAGKYGKITYIDILVLLYMAWRTFTPFVNNPRLALEYAGSNSIIFLGGYLAARAFIRSARDFQVMALVLAGFVFISFPFAAYETSTSKMVLPAIFEMIPGVSSVRDVNYDPRFGFHRVQFVFVHPIHYGLFCSMAFGLFFVALRDRIPAFWRWTGMWVILGCVFMSVSSGPFLATLAQIGLILWAYMFRNVERGWLILGLLALFCYVVIEIGSNRPGIYAVLSILSFSPSTANVRIILLEYGMAQIARTPWLGIGFRQWDLPSWMTGSLDNFWLAIALVFGVPAFLFLILAFFAGMIGVGRRKFAPGGDLANARLAWVIVMISITLTLATVYVWSEVASLVMFVLGSGVFLLHVQEPKSGEDPPPALPQAREGPVYSRFSPAISRSDAKGDAPRYARQPEGRL